MNAIPEQIKPLIILLALFAFGPSVNTSAESGNSINPKPNIIMIMARDIGRHLNCYGINTVQSSVQFQNIGRDSRMGLRLLKSLMFRKFNYFILKFPAEVIEIITVTRNPHDQIPVFFGLLLGLSEGFSRNHIKLYVVPIHSEITPDQSLDFLLTGFRIKE